MSRASLRSVGNLRAQPGYWREVIEHLGIHMESRPGMRFERYRRFGRRMVDTTTER